METETCGVIIFFVEPLGGKELGGKEIQRPRISIEYCYQVSRIDLIEFSHHVPFSTSSTMVLMLQNHLKFFLNHHFFFVLFSARSNWNDEQTNETTSPSSGNTG